MLGVGAGLGAGLAAVAAAPAAAAAAGGQPAGPAGAVPAGPAAGSAADPAAGQGCSSGAAVLGLLAVGGAVLAAQQLLGADEAAEEDGRFIVDCGSGGSRVEKFVAGAAGKVRLAAKGRVDAAALHKVIAKGEEAQRSWLAALAEEISDDPSTPILIGGTGGVREAIASGAITPAARRGFEQLVAERFGSRARFVVVEGTEEASDELAAVRYIVQEKWGRSGAVAESQVSLISSGGMSSQLVYGSPARSLSLPTQIKTGNRLALERGVEAGLAAFDEAVAATVAAEPALAGAALSGTFVAIELLAQAGDNAGIARRLISAEDAAAALREHLAHFKAAAGAASEEERRDWNWKDVAPGTYTTLALRLIGLMEPQTQLYFCRQFELADGRTLKPAWPLGWYLNSRRAVGL